MGARSSFDRESLQKLLASAFAVQESGLDTPSLSALIELQRLTATGALDVDRAMHLIAERAQSVAHATGIAIALLKADQLVYRAGSGSAASYLGRQVTAILSASVNNESRGEILRVEHAQTDTRIEAAICREFGAQALLILPICQENAVAGVLEVLFDEPHVFQEREVRTYRLMAGLVEEAMFRNLRGERKQTPVRPTTVPRAIEQIIFQMERFRRTDESAPGPARKPWVVPPRRAGTAPSVELPTATPAISFTQRVIRSSLDKPRLSGAAAAAVIAFAIAGWMIYHYRPASQVDATVQPRSSATLQQIPSLPTMPSPSNRMSKAQTAADGTAEGMAEGRREATPGSGFKRIRVGPSEVDYFAEDVTIRHFIPKPAPPMRAPGGYREVQIGQDVTVRYFASKPRFGLHTRPLSTAAQSAERSLPTPK